MAATEVFRINERCTARVTGTLKDTSGIAITSQQLTTFVGTLYNKADATIINSFDDKNLISYVSNGDVDFDLVTLDNVIVDTTLTEETHILLLEWTWAAGSKSGKQELVFAVKNMLKVP